MFDCFEASGLYSLSNRELIQSRSIIEPAIKSRIQKNMSKSAAIVNKDTGIRERKRDG